MTTGTSISPLRILLRLDAGHAIGLGHAVRSRALLDALGRPVELSVAGGGEALAALFPAATLYGAEDAAALVARLCPDAVLVDLPHLPEAGWRQLHAAGRPLIAIDDEGGAVVADLVINGTVLERYHHYPRLPKDARLLCGPAHTLLRPDFADQPWRGEDSRGVVIVAGGGDRARDWVFALTGGTLDRSDWGPVSLVVGAAFPAYNDLAAACEPAGITLVRGLDAMRLAEMLAGARVALITGGMILYEAMAVGVPTVVFPQIPNLPPEAEWFAARGAVHDLGYEGGMEMEQVGRAVGGLLARPLTANAQSRTARALVDGHGLARAAQAVNALVDGSGR